MNTRVTRSALSLCALVVASALETVHAAGPTLPYAEVQAEDATTNGTIIGPNRAYPGLATEAIGRRAVTLVQGQYVEFTAPVAANSIVLRYSIPDSADGVGRDATLGLTIGGVAQPDLAVTSRYGWFYGGYPFNNNPSDLRGHHFYDEVRRLTGSIAAGTKVRVQVNANNAAPSYTIDLIDFEQVAPALAQPAGSLSITTDFGADASGIGDSTTAIQNAINGASSQGKVLFIPQGTFKVTAQLHVNNVTIKGAGIWYSSVHFTTPTGSSEGFYGNYAPTPSTNVHLSDFAILGEVVIRNDGDQINGIGGSFNNSDITNLWIEHTKCGMWLDGPFDKLTVTNVRIRDVIADGINFHKGVTNSVVTQSIFRNTGDDGLAVWSDANGTSVAAANNTFSFNRVEIPVLANGIALYGGTSNSVTDNYIADQQAEGGGIHVGIRFSPVTPLAGTTTIARNTIVRAGSFDYYNSWNFGTGALWLYALDGPISGVSITSNQILDSNYEAIHFIGNNPITGVTLSGNTISGAGTYAVEVRDSSGSVSFNNTTVAGIGQSGSPIMSCATAFTLGDGGGNGSWITTAPACPGTYPTAVYAPIATPTATPTACTSCTATATATRTPTPTATATATVTPTPVPGSNLAQGKAITASSVQQTFAAANANDGSVTTYWEGAPGTYPNTLTVTLGGNAAIASVVVKLDPNTVWSTRAQTIQVLGHNSSTSTFSSLVGATTYTFDPSANGNSVTIPVAATVSDVQLSITANSGATGGQVAEFQVIAGGATATATFTATASATRTPTPTSTPTATPTTGATATFTATATRTATATATTASSGTIVTLPFNVNAAYSDGTTFASTGGIDGAGSAYSSTLLGTTMSGSGTTFSFGATNALNGVRNATVTLPAGQYSTLLLLGTGVNGDQTSQTVRVNYTDGTSSTFTQTFSNWLNAGQSIAGQSIASTMAYRNKSTGVKDNRAFNLYGYSFALTSTKTVASLVLPATNNVTILAATLRTGAVATPTSTATPTATATATPTTSAGICAGVPAFQSCTAYASGAKVVFGNALYHSVAPIPSTRDCPPNSPFDPSNDNWWINDGGC
jgi:hypothetical protein